MKRYYPAGIAKGMLVAVLLTALYGLVSPMQAAAFKMTVTNQNAQNRSFSMFWYDENVDKWVCAGWYNVAGGEQKVFSFKESVNLPYAYLYSANWNGGDRSDTIDLPVVKERFRYYQDEEGPQGTDARLVTFAKIAVGQAGARLDFSASAQPAAPKPVVRNNMGNRIVALAMQLKGKPYVWGGASPESGFDCSGFTYYVLGQLGISLERTADLQFHPQEAVAFKDLQPGDLVFFAWHGGEAEHVGIYLGNGRYIDAQNTDGAGPGATGEVMVSAFDNWNRKFFVGGRRFR